MVTIKQTVGLVRDILAGRPAVPRSVHWPAVMHAHLLKEPVCQVCGGKVQLNVHHKRPFHLYPDLELADGTGRWCQAKGPDGAFVDNLITLCNHLHCHFHYGHLLSWHAYNPTVVEDCMRARAQVAGRLVG